jgi:predicted nuclease of predicted toxin-antitoxin system
VRVLLDECLPRRLLADLPGHEIATVQSMGWAGLKNVVLLRTAADAKFEALITVDRGIEFQQSVADLPLSVIALSSRSNSINELRPLMPAVLALLADLRPGHVIRVP